MGYDVDSKPPNEPGRLMSFGCLRMMSSTASKSPSLHVFVASNAKPNHSGLVFGDGQVNSAASTAVLALIKNRVRVSSFERSCVVSDFLVIDENPPEHLNPITTFGFQWIFNDSN